jgi:hypothetical protein
MTPPETRFLHDGQLLTMTEIQAQPKQPEQPKQLPFACCEKAEWSNASPGYAYAYTCPIHGETRIGSSD